MRVNGFHVAFKRGTPSYSKDFQFTGYPTLQDLINYKNQQKLNNTDWTAKFTNDTINAIKELEDAISGKPNPLIPSVLDPLDNVDILILGVFGALLIFT
jgi:hypothetical protein